ncbi:MAG TPA: hypothetical protein VJ506_03560 [Candidatus Limnocylindrales bacterium]|nr:hypothetical protein [Candidatus Limnocylindrales bacterium]
MTYDQGPIRVYGWDWGRDEDRRPQVPWVGVFLLILGGLLIFEQLAPQYRDLGNVVVLAAGLAFLVVWLLRRSSFSLYAGALLTAAAVPGLIEGVTQRSLAGLGTVAYGVAFLFIAVVRAVSRGGWGWQLVFGLVLLAVGASEMTLPDLADLTLPLLLVILGVVLISRGRR